jgi:hypothetical protein
MEDLFGTWQSDAATIFGNAMGEFNQTVRLIVAKLQGLSVEVKSGATINLGHWFGGGFNETADAYGRFVDGSAGFQALLTETSAGCRRFAGMSTAYPRSPGGCAVDLSRTRRRRRASRTPRRGPAC